MKADSSLLSAWSALAAGGGSEGGGASSGGGWGGKDVDRGGIAASKAMRRHFAELTSAFLEPFRVYFEPGEDGLVSGCWEGQTEIVTVAHCSVLGPVDLSSL